MINKKTISLIFLLSFSIVDNLLAKENDLGVWIDLAATKKIHAATFGVVGQIYTHQNCSTLEKAGLGIKGDYTVFPWLSTGAGLMFMEFKHPGYYELKERYYFQLEPSWNSSKFHFSFRERLQVTHYPEALTFTPANKLWRNRFEACYIDPSWKLEPLIDLESLFLLKEWNLKNFTEFRYLLGANYHLARNQKIKFYGMLTESSTLSRFIIGLAYEIKL